MPSLDLYNAHFSTAHPSGGIYYGRATVNRVDFSVVAVAVHDVDGRQVPTHAHADRFYQAARNINDATSRESDRLETVYIPGLSGEYVLLLVPFGVYPSL